MDNKSSFSFINDKYKVARGGHSRLLNVCCGICKNIVAVYQKDGPGNLRRMYIDRIFSLDEFANLQTVSIKDYPVLTCKKCGEVLGTPYVYPKEKRKAFRLYQDSVITQRRKLRE